MRIEIFGLRREGDKLVPDADNRVAVVTVTEGRGEIVVFKPERERRLREMFESDASEFVGGGTDKDGSQVDAVRDHPAWSRQAIECVLRNDLDAASLAGIIVEE